MSAPIPRFEADDTRQFTITYSAAPANAPSFAIHAGSGAAVLVHSVTATQSGATPDYYAFFTFPNTTQLYAYTWVASFTSAGSGIVSRGMFQTIRTTP